MDRLWLEQSTYITAKKLDDSQEKLYRKTTEGLSMGVRGLIATHTLVGIPDNTARDRVDILGEEVVVVVVVLRRRRT